MKTILNLSLLSVAFLSVATAQITIEVVGDGIGYDLMGEFTKEVSAYRSTGIVKTFDADGDNVYGTEGVLAFGNGGVRLNHQPFSIHTQVGVSWAHFSPGQHFWSIAQDRLDSKPMDDPTAAVSDHVVNWGSVGMLAADGMPGSGAWAEMLKFDIHSGAPQRFRLGLIAGSQFAPSGHWDPTGLRVTADGGRTYATVIQLENNKNGHANMVFFDVNLNGSKSGTLAIWGQQERLNWPVRNKGGVQNPNIEGASLTAIVFDRISGREGAYVDIPESRSYSFLVGGMALALAMFRRRTYFKTSLSIQ
jgi:hypothetical protein